MRALDLGAGPNSLSRLATGSPSHGWPLPDDVRADVDQALADRQFQRCAYCESRLGPPTPRATTDFAIEHFHPKSVRVCADGRVADPNWNIDWNNLLAVCRGGQPKPTRELAKPSAGTLHCDRSTAKAGEDLCAKILDPRQMAGDRHFRCDSSGALAVDGATCPPAATEQASATIAALNLNSKLLTARREAVLAEIDQAVLDLAEQLDPDSTKTSIARAMDMVLHDVEAAAEPQEFITSVQSALV